MVYPQVAKTRLRGNRRAADDKEYAEFLLSLGDGDFIGLDGPLPKDLHPASVRLPDQLVDPAMSKLGLLQWVYPKPPHCTADEVGIAEYYSGRAIVTPTNADADELNASMLRG